VARELVQCDSQTPPSDTRMAAEVAIKYLTPIPGISIARHESVAPVMNVVARLGGGRPGRRLVLSGHLDTYPIGDRAAWSVDPLGGELLDGRLYGRGSADMKGGIAALIAVMAAFAECAPGFAGELVLALAGDEESMGELGTQWLIDNVPLVRCDAVIVADVGSPAIVRIGEKGMVWADVEAEGTSAHGAHLHRGVNAIDRLMQAVDEIRRAVALTPKPPQDVLDTIASARPLSEPLGGAGEAEILQMVTVNLGTVQGGTSANLVPDKASASLDIRIPVGLSVSDIESALHKAIGKSKGVRLTITRRYEPTWTSPGEPIAMAGLAAAAEVLEREVAVNMRIGGSDARLWRRAGIATIVAGLTPHNLGAADEYFEVSELAPLATIHALTAARYLGLR
jgi:acetylornithine deacetylase/succinyl-diaminopimelate desuccinylase-like protein